MGFFLSCGLKPRVWDSQVLQLCSTAWLCPCPFLFLSERVSEQHIRVGPGFFCFILIRQGTQALGEKPRQLFVQKDRITGWRDGLSAAFDFKHQKAYQCIETPKWITDPAVKALVQRTTEYLKENFSKDVQSFCCAGGAHTGIEMGCEAQRLIWHKILRK